MRISQPLRNVTVILILRLYAMYDANRYILWLLSALLLAKIAAETAIIGPIAAHGLSTCLFDLIILC